MGYEVGSEKGGGIRVSTGGGTSYVQRQSKTPPIPSSGLRKQPMKMGKMTPMGKPKMMASKGLSAQQITSIKNSPAGMLPRFLNKYVDKK